MSDVRTILEQGIGGATPPPDGFERMLRRRDRRRRNQRIAAAVVGVAVFVVAIAIVTTGGAVDRSEKPATTSGTGPSVSPGLTEPVGLVGLPPGEATPSLPKRGELVVGFVFGHTMGDPGRFGLHLYADGRVIWEKLGEAYAGGDPTPTGLIEQRLTPDGVELIRSEVLSLGLFDRDRHLVGGYVPNFGWIEVQDGDRLARVTWGDAGSGFPPGQDTQATLEQGRALQRLDARLEDLPSWLPASAWVDREPKPFVASRYSVCYDTEPGVGLDRVLGSFPPSAEERLRPLDRTHEVSDRHGPTGTGFEVWCSTVSTDEARSLAEILDTADTAVSVRRDAFGLAYEFRQRDLDGTHVTLAFYPALPDGR
jgi:hypothetical protein